MAFLSFFVKSPYTCLYKFAYKLKIVTGLQWECFQILIFCMVVACSFPFLPLLRHYALLVLVKSASKKISPGPAWKPPLHCGTFEPPTQWDTFCEGYTIRVIQFVLYNLLRVTWFQAGYCELLHLHGLGFSISQKCIPKNFPMKASSVLWHIWTTHAVG